MRIIMGGRTTPPRIKMPPPVPPPAQMDVPETVEAELDMEPTSSGEAATGKHRKYRKKAKGKGKSVSHAKYKGGGLTV
jgi:hypothetical protein